MPTFEDIAKMAGVSKATVSLALSDSPKISIETKTKIRNIAKNIGYPLNAAQNGGKLRNQSIGVLYMSEHLDYEREFFRDTLIGITEDSAGKGFDVVFIGAHPKDGERLAEEIADRVIRSGVEGIIVISRVEKIDGLNKLIDMRFPMVFIGDRKVSGYGQQLFNVCSDNYHGGRAAAEYLTGLGHTRIAMVAKTKMPNWELDRANGFLSYLQNAGHPDASSRQVAISKVAFDPEDECWNRLEAIHPTAIFAINASVGISVLHYLRAAGRRIPEDVSLVIFDDFASFPYENPPITVVKQDKEGLGSLAVKVLIDILEKPSLPPRQLQISTHLVERSSCARIGE